MSAIILGFVACFGARCELTELWWSGSQFQCELYGQQAISTWLSERPGWTWQGRYTCGPVERAA